MSSETEKALLAVLSDIAGSLRAIAQGGGGVATAGGSAPGGGDSSRVVVPWGKNKGKTLGELADRSLGFYAFDWVPNVREGYTEPRRADVEFQAAARAEARRRGVKPYAKKEESGGGEGAPTARREAPPNGQAFPTDGPEEEDIPF